MTENPFNDVPTPATSALMKQRPVQQELDINLPTVITEDPPIRRGDVFWIVDGKNLPTGTEIWPNRPGLVVSADTFNNAGFVQIVYLTTSTNKRISPAHINLGIIGRHMQESLALCEQIHTVDTSRLRRKPNGTIDLIDHINDDLMNNVNDALSYTLSLHRNPNTASFFKKWEMYIHDNHIDLSQVTRDLHTISTNKYIQELETLLHQANTERDSFKNLWLIERDRNKTLSHEASNKTTVVTKADET